MKLLILALAVAAAPMAAQADLSQTQLVCKGQGQSGGAYEVTIANKRAVIQLNGKQVGSLRLQSVRQSPGGDQKTVATYFQPIVNGYSVRVESGGLAPITTAEIFHGGVAGYVPVAKIVCQVP